MITLTDSTQYVAPKSMRTEGVSDVSVTTDVDGSPSVKGIAENEAATPGTTVAGLPTRKLITK